MDKANLVITTREVLKQKLDNFTDEQIAKIADFMDFLEFQFQKKDVPDDTTKEQLLSNFRQAWHEAMTGQTVPVSQIWEDIDHD